MIDSDVLININSPNIFDYHKSKSVSVISLRKNMPYLWEETTRKISYFEINFIQKNIFRFSDQYIAKKFI